MCICYIYLNIYTGVMYYIHIERASMDDLTTLRYFDFTEIFKRTHTALEINWFLI